ncbi:MAG: hypothetical protein ACFBQW_06515 [Sphingomonadaceae bacterium]
MLAAISRSALFAAGLLALAACVPAADAPPAASPVPAASPNAAGQGLAGLEGVMGATAAALAARFGPPALDIREGEARKLQFAGRACVLDAYLYPPRGGGEPVVTYVDARLPDGRDADRASCVRAIARVP